MENIRAFGRYSRFPVCEVNTAYSFPPSLRGLRFEAVVFHYSIFDPLCYRLGGEFLDYLDSSRPAYKVAIFQDEYHYCRQRFAFLDRHAVDCVYTLVEPRYFEEVYGKYTSVPRLVSHIPGYVSQEMVEAGRRLTLPDEKRKVDVGYRARRLPFYMGRGAQEKYEIGLKFRERAAGTGLRLDIEVDEQARIYGDAWYKFMANCRAVLGVESGVSVFDLEDAVRAECERLTAQNPSATFEEVHERVLSRWEGNIPYRTISPRHFEAAALRVCQILFEGEYSGIMRPLVHYIPLKKDFSNFDDVLAMFRDGALRRELTVNAYRDLIASELYTYRAFVEGFDSGLIEAGLRPGPLPPEGARRLAAVSREAGRMQWRGVAKARVYNFLMTPKPLALVTRPSLRAFKRLRRGVGGAG